VHSQPPMLTRAVQANECTVRDARPLGHRSVAIHTGLVGRIPLCRAVDEYTATCIAGASCLHQIEEDRLVIFGGHDGGSRLNRTTRGATYLPSRWPANPFLSPSSAVRLFHRYPYQTSICINKVVRLREQGEERHADPLRPRGGNPAGAPDEVAADCRTHRLVLFHYTAVYCRATGASPPSRPCHAKNLSLTSFDPWSRLQSTTRAQQNAP
jgi:hypothetical protein